MPAITEETMTAFLDYEPAQKELEEQMSRADMLPRDKVAKLGMLVVAKHWEAWAQTVDPPSLDVIADIQRRLASLERHPLLKVRKGALK